MTSERSKSVKTHRDRERHAKALRRGAKVSFRESLARELPDDLMEEALERPRDFGRDLDP